MRLEMHWSQTTQELADLLLDLAFILPKNRKNPLRFSGSVG